MTCAFTGPRPQNLPILLDPKPMAYFDLYRRLLKETTLLCKQGVTDFYCGMALGCDLLFAEIVIGLKKAYPIKLHAAVPFRGQPDAWNRADRALYTFLLERCDSAVAFMRHIRKAAAWNVACITLEPLNVNGFTCQFSDLAHFGTASLVCQ